VADTAGAGPQDFWWVSRVMRQTHPKLPLPVRAGSRKPRNSRRVPRALQATLRMLWRAAHHLRETVAGCWRRLRSRVVPQSGSRRFRDYAWPASVANARSDTHIPVRGNLERAASKLVRQHRAQPRRRLRGSITGSARHRRSKPEGLG